MQQFSPTLLHEYRETARKASSRFMRYQDHCIAQLIVRRILCFACTEWMSKLCCFYGHFCVYLTTFFRVHSGTRDSSDP